MTTHDNEVAEALSEREQKLEKLHATGEALEGCAKTMADMSVRAAVLPPCHCHCCRRSSPRAAALLRKQLPSLLHPPHGTIIRLSTTHTTRGGGTHLRAPARTRIVQDVAVATHGADKAKKGWFGRKKKTKNKNKKAARERALA